MYLLRHCFFLHWACTEEINYCLKLGSIINIQCCKPIVYVDINLNSCPYVPLFMLLFTKSCLFSVNLMFASFSFSLPQFSHSASSLYSLFRLPIGLQSRALMNGATGVLTFHYGKVCSCYTKVTKGKVERARITLNCKEFSFPERTCMPSPSLLSFPLFSLQSPLNL